MDEIPRSVTANPADDPTGGTHPGRPDFSLVLGGPTFQFARRTHLSGNAGEGLRRRVLAITLWVWLPLLVLSIIERYAIAGAIQIPFLHDIEVNVRFLIALPILILAEVVVQERISPLVRRFEERRIVVAEDLPAFDAAINSALRARDSVVLEAILVVLVYTLGLWIWRSQVALENPTWYALPEPEHLHLTWAGYWYVLVSLPVFQFVVLRWYMRLGIWFRLLWKISRLNLHLSAAHPDRAGGIGFLGKSSYAFSPILFAQGTLMAGLIASRIRYEGQTLLSFKMEAAGFVVFFVLVILGPLLMFTPILEGAQRRGAAEYGRLASRYVFAFEDKWIRSGEPETPALADSEDIQSLADLDNAYSNVRKMRIVPFGLDEMGRLAAATAAPLLPLLLTVFSLPELLKVLVKIVFK